MNKELEKTKKEIWALFKESRAIQQKTDQQMAENAKKTAEIDRQMTENAKKTAEIDRQMTENAKKTAEIDQQMAETDKLLKDTIREIRKSDKKVKKFIGHTTNYWGALGENLVKGNLAKRLNEKGIKVEKVITNLENQFAEFDIVAINGKEIVVVEVKSTLEPLDVDKFEKNLKQFNKWWGVIVGHKTIYGAMAFLIKEKHSAGDIAERRGFFVISATGDVMIKNQKHFKPKVFFPLKA